MPFTPRDQFDHHSQAGEPMSDAGRPLPDRRRTDAPARVPAQGSPSMGQDLVRTITETAQAVRCLDATDCPAADITVTAVTAPVCVGDTQADALQAAADLAREMSYLQINAVSIARVPGHADGVWQWAVTLYVESADPCTGGYSGEVHHGDRVPRRGY